MVGYLQPLAHNFAIVNELGYPTEYFIRWAQQKQIDIEESVGEARALEIVKTFLTEHPLQAGSGIDLTPNGDLNNSPTISAKAQEILDQITTTQGSVLFRGAAGWEPLPPGTSTQYLKSGGPAANPLWDTPAGGGGGGGAFYSWPSGAIGGVTGQPHPAKGRAFRVEADCTLSGVFALSQTSSISYKITVLEVDSINSNSSLVTNIVYDSPFQLKPTSAREFIEANSPINLVKGRIYCILLVSSDASPVAIYYNNGRGVMQGLPISESLGARSLVSPLVIGSVVETNIDDTYTSGLIV